VEARAIKPQRFGRGYLWLLLLRKEWTAANAQQTPRRGERKIPISATFLMGIPSSRAKSRRISTAYGISTMRLHPGRLEDQLPPDPERGLRWDGEKGNLEQIRPMVKWPGSLIAASRHRCPRSASGLRSRGGHGFAGVERATPDTSVDMDKTNWQAPHSAAAYKAREKWVITRRLRACFTWRSVVNGTTTTNF
jgi:hypothetical protein